MARTKQEYGKRRPKNKRISTQSLKKLPKGWRILVCKALEEQGTSAEPQAITDVLRGHVKNLDLLKKVRAIMQEISKKYMEEERERKALLIA